MFFSYQVFHFAWLLPKSCPVMRTKDMAAMLVFCLKEIDLGIDESAAVWEKRDYWIKAERLRQRWHWVSQSALQLETLIREEQWHYLPEQMMVLFPHFADIKVTRFTRSSDLWEGAYQKLLTD